MSTTSNAGLTLDARQVAESTGLGLMDLADLFRREARYQFTLAGDVAREPWGDAESPLARGQRCVAAAVAFEAAWQEDNPDDEDEGASSLT